jgi:hypothetical protein
VAGVLELKFVPQVERHLWIPAFAGMTEKSRMRYLTDFGYNVR